MAVHGICAVPSCNKTRIVARGFCEAHYRRFMKYGDPLATPERTPGATLQFIHDAVASETNDCIEWPFSKMRGGYGHLLHEGRYRPAHRLVCEIVHGAPSVSTMQAAHSCNNTSCVNPRHLRWASPLENIADKAAHGTLLYGEAAPQTFLSEREVKAMLRLVRGGVKQREVAKAFGVTPQRVNEIVLGKAWKHVDVEAL